jgi:hypothetical protein
LKTAYVVAVSGILVVLGLLFYPTVNTMVGGAVDAGSGWLDLTVAGVTVLPYFFLAVVVYAIIKLSNK